MLVHLFAGERAIEWRRNSINGIEVITLDINEGQKQDIHNPGTWSFLLPAWETSCGHHWKTSLPGLIDREKNLADSDAALLLISKLDCS